MKSNFVLSKTAPGTCIKGFKSHVTCSCMIWFTGFLPERLYYLQQLTLTRRWNLNFLLPVILKSPVQVFARDLFVSMPVGMRLPSDSFFAFLCMLFGLSVR